MANKRSLSGLWLAAALLMVSTVAWAELSLEQAIEKVEHETRGKVLGAETVYLAEQKVYRIKVLTREGEVRVIQVQADSQ